MISEPLLSLETTQQVQSSLKLLSSVTTFQSNKITHLEDRKRPSTLIIHSLEEIAEETDETLKKSCRRRIQINIRRRVQINRAHSLALPAYHLEVSNRFPQDFNEKNATFANVTEQKKLKIICTMTFPNKPRASAKCYRIWEDGQKGWKKRSIFFRFVCTSERTSNCPIRENKNVQP